MEISPQTQTTLVPVPAPPLKRMVDKVGGFLLAYWDLILCLFFGLISFSALFTPILAFLDLDELARPLFAFQGHFCGQIASHSFYIAGHQVGLCIHCLAIYSSLFAGCLIFVLSKRRIPPLPWWGMLLLALPLAYDGFSQMFGLRESTWEIRLLTGALFGLGGAWFALPFMHRKLVETPDAPDAAPPI